MSHDASNLSQAERAALGLAGWGLCSACWQVGLGPGSLWTAGSGLLLCAIAGLWAAALFQRRRWVARRGVLAVLTGAGLLWALACLVRAMKSGGIYGYSVLFLGLENWWAWARSAHRMALTEDSWSRPSEEAWSVRLCAAFPYNGRLFVVTTMAILQGLKYLGLRSLASLVGATAAVVIALAAAAFLALVLHGLVMLALHRFDLDSLERQLDAA